MKTIRTLMLTVAAAACLASSNAGAAGSLNNPATPAPADQLAAEADTAPRLGIDEIEKLFSGKTWTWGETGGGYFNKTREFVAFNIDPESPTAAQGRWRLYESGKICLDANWKTRKAETQALTCFQMRGSVDKTIYMKRDPAGPWFVFRGAKPAPTDEAAKLVDGDKVTARLDEVARLSAPKKK